MTGWVNGERGPSSAAMLLSVGKLSVLFLNDVIYWLATSLNFCKYENNEILTSLQSLSYFVLLEELAGLPSDLTLSLIVVLSCQ